MTRSVAVIIPAHNHGRLLPTAVRSVLTQHNTDLEVLIVDDGSDDDTVRVIVELTSPRVLAIRQPRAGPAAARNAAAERTTAEWIAFLDADDEWLPGKLEAQLRALAANPGAAFCYGGVIVREPNGVHSTVAPPSPPLFPALWRGNCLATPSVVVRRTALSAVGGFCSDLQTGEDWDLWLRLADQFSATMVAEPVAIVNRGSSTSAVKLAVYQRCTLSILDRLFSSAETLGRWPELKTQRRRLYSWHYSVLARSYLRQGMLLEGARLAWAALIGGRQRASVRRGGKNA